MSDRCHSISPQRTAYAVAAALGLLGLGSMLACGGLPWGYPSVVGHVYVNNANDLEIARHVRQLRPELQLDCSAIAEDPGRRLTTDAFGDTVHWLLPAGTNLGIEFQTRGCGAAMIAGPGIEPTIVFVDYEQFSAEFFPGHSFDGVDADAGLGLEFDDDGRASWIGNPDIRFVPRSDPPDQPQACEPPASEHRLDWSTPRSAKVEILALNPGADGCYALELQDLELLDSPALIGEPYTFFLCAPAIAVPFAIGERLALQYNDASWGEELIATTLDPQTLLYAIDEATGVDVRRVRYLRGTSRDWTIDYRLGRDAYVVGDECAWHAEAGCATVERRVDLAVVDYGVLEIGVANLLPDPPGPEAKHRTLIPLHVRQRAVVDPVCSDGAIVLDHDIDIVFIDEPL
jgi:hypothetical protein